MEHDASNACSSCGSWWRLSLLLALVLTAILLWHWCHDRTTQSALSSSTEPAAGESATREKVSLTIDFGNGRRQEFESVAWHQGMTVADSLSAARGLATSQKGSGSGAFLTEINGVANEGADGRNWMYEVNGAGADRSFAVYVLRPGDRVLWTFGPAR
jgi:hypothetical protein